MIYSHSSLDKYDLCPRRFYYHYELGLREPQGLAAAYSTHLIHAPIEAYVRDWLGGGAGRAAIDWDATYDAYWLEFRRELDLMPDFDDVLYSLANAKRVLAMYVKDPIDGDYIAVEERGYLTFPNGMQYVSIPDFLVRNERGLSTVDLKMTSGWKIPPLSPYDDQFLGQAIPLGADGFYRVTIQGDKKSGRITLLPAEWQPVDPVLAGEWRDEVAQQIDLIEQDRLRVRGNWRKKDKNCNAFGRECTWKGRCEIGLEANRPAAMQRGGVGLT